MRPAPLEIQFPFGRKSISLQVQTIELSQEMETSNLCRQVAVSGWIIIATSALLLLAGVIGAGRTLAGPLGPLFLVLGLGYAVGRLMVGVAILKGRNWARVLYLVGELLVLNLSIALLREPQSEKTGGQAMFALFPVLFYVVVLILLTRRVALTHFGWPVVPAINIRRTVLAVALFCFVYAGVAALANVFGAPAMSIVSDRFNPASLAGNALGEATGLRFLESATERQRKALSSSIMAAKSLDAMGEFIGANVYQSYVAVNENELRVALIWVANIVGLVLLRRRP